MRKIVSSVIVFNPRAEVLLGYKLKRELWEIPGGKMDGDETVLRCAERELYEETGITAPRKLNYLGYYDSLPEWLTHMFTCISVEEPRVMEPHKHDRWEWFDMDELPPMTQCCKEEFDLFFIQAYNKCFRS